MTDHIDRPGDVCTASRDADVPTGFQVATETLGIRHDQEAGVVASPHFTEGWEAGVEDSLSTTVMPFETGEEHQQHRVAWLAGFIAGQIARRHNYGTPFCIDPGHGSECIEMTIAA